MQQRQQRRNADYTLGEGSYEEALEWIERADRILLGAGAGLTAAAGYDYSDQQRFKELFPVLAQAGFSARYQLIGYPLPPRYMWGFWSVHVNDIRFGVEPDPLYQQLRQIVGEKDYFVMSSNVDALFERNGFDREKIFTPQGDYALYQCLTPCTREVWNDHQMIKNCLDHFDPETGMVDEVAVPHCPNCGGEVFLNVYAGSWYINDHFLPQAHKEREWIEEEVNESKEGENLVIVEIGAGFNTPGVIRWPMEKFAEKFPKAHFIRINRDHAEVPSSLAHRSVSLSDDAGEILAKLGEDMGV